MGWRDVLSLRPRHVKDSILATSAYVMTHGRFVAMPHKMSQVVDERLSMTGRGVKTCGVCSGLLNIYYI